MAVADSRFKKLFQACGGYIAASVAVWGVVDLAISAFSFPETALRSAMIASAVGLPVVAAATWMSARAEERGEVARDHSVQVHGIFAGGLLATTVFVVLLFVADPQPAPTPEAADIEVKSRAAIAIMPFANLSDEGSNEHFAIGVADDIVTNLQSWGLFPVIGRNVTEPYRGEAPDLVNVGEALGVRYLLIGSVRTAGNDIRVSAQLIDAESNEVIKALGPFDRTRSDVFAIQDEISIQIVNSIAPEMLRREIQSASIDRPADLASWELVMRALGLTLQGKYEAARQAEELLRLAIEREPGYAAAYTRLAEIGHDLSTTSYATIIGNDAATDALNEALANARMAVRANPALVDARIWYGHLLLHHRQVEAAIGELREAVRLSPSHGQAHAELGFGLAITGDLDAAFNEFQIASQLSPNDPRSTRIRTFEAFGYLYSQRYEEAADLARQVVVDNPGSARLTLTYLIDISSLVRLNRVDVARQRVDEYLEQFGALDWPAVTRAAWSEEQLALVKADVESLGMLPRGEEQ